MKQELKNDDHASSAAVRCGSGSAGGRTFGIGPDLERRVKSVAIGVRDDLIPIVEAVGGSRIQPGMLARIVGIDQSLASRLIRAIRASDPLKILNAIPAPNGLRIFLEAAGKAKVDPDLCQRAAASVDRFQLLIGEFPAGRAGLDAALSGSVPELRARAERTAKQSAFKAMSYLLGHQTDATIGAVVRQPSSNGRTCDEIHVLGMHGVRRTRLGRPITVFGFRAYGIDEPSDVDTVFRTVDGEVTPSDLQKFLLRPFCSDPLPHLKGINDGDYVALTLADDTLDVNVPATLVSAYVTSGCLRYRTDTLPEDAYINVLRFPSRIYLRDMFIHEEMHVGGGAPDLSVRLPSVRDQRVRSTGPARDLHGLDLSVSVESLGMGLSNIDCKEVPSHAESIRYAFDRVGWDPNRFHVYRYQVIYPVPLVSFTWWFPLADPPQPDSDPQA